MLFEFDDFVLDESAYELRRGGAVVKLDPKAFDMLRVMVRHPGELLTKGALVQHVWEGRALSDTVLTGTVSRLRAALGNGARDHLIVSVYGQGYRFAGNVRQRTMARRPKDETPFVGRSAALARVQRGLEQVRLGRGQIVAIVGEPGIGKTHLADLAAEGAGELGIPSAWAQCRELETAPPFFPFVQLLRGALRASGSTAEARAAVDGALSALTPERDPSPGWGVNGSHYRLFDGIARALQTLTDDGPLLLVLDDVQWADAASLRLLAYLTPEIAHMRLMILIIARTTAPALGTGPLLHMLGHRSCEYIELDRLTEAEVAEYTALSIGSAASDVSREVFARSEGNPFFMVELLRPFSRSAPPRPDELALTGPALDIVRERLRSLGPETTALLSAAAVVGREFHLGLLAYVSEQDPEAILDRLERAYETSTIRSQGNRPGHFVFGHDLIRHVLLTTLSAKQLAQLHLRAADALERRHPVGDGLPGPEIVHHLLAALPLGDPERVVDYATRSALAAANVCAHADAAHLLRRVLAALELTSDVRPRSRCELLLGLSFCERASADERFSEHLSEAVALGREHGFGEILAEAGSHMSVAPGLLALKGAREVLEAAERALPPTDHRRRCEILAHLAWTSPYCFDAELAASLVTRAEALALESGDSVALCLALSAKIYFANGPDSRALAEAISSDMDRLHAERPPFVRLHWAAQKELSRIVTALQYGDAEAVDHAMAAFGAAARELKHPELEWHHARACAVHRMNRGEFAGLERVVRDLHERAEGLRLFSLPGVRAIDGCVLLRETASLPGLAPFETLLALQEGDCPYRRARKIRSMAEMGAVERARAALHDLPPERLERLPHDRDYLATLVHFAVASMATDSREHAGVLYALLAPYPHLYAADLSLHCEGSVSHVLGTLARSLGRPKEALQHLEEALERNERAGFRPSAAHSAYELACAHSDVARKRALFTRVIEVTREMGMTPLMRRAEERLQGL